MQPLKNIIFDLGGVILNIDYGRTEQAFIRLGFSRFSGQYTQFHSSRQFDEYETGKLDTESFIEHLKLQCDPQTTGDQVRDAWNAMLLDLPQARLDLLRVLRGRYKLYLLSNTNSIHLEKIMQAHCRSLGPEGLNGLFDKVYFSCITGSRKPERSCYEQVLKENKLQPEETIFIDDTPKNVDAAMALGIQTVFLKPPLTIKDVFGDGNGPFQLPGQGSIKGN